MPRVEIKKKPPSNFLPSGSTLLDLVNGGGWAFGRVVNIVGDKSAGKTLLAIEACANFAHAFGADNIRYAEAEAAFDVNYARTMGFPAGVIPTEPGEISTVEDFERDLSEWLAERDGKQPCLYIIDSLDALSDEAELKKHDQRINKGDGEKISGSYGTAKAKAMSELFRKLNDTASAKRCLLIVISQIRDKIGVTFGETKTRSGGRALDFYASQIVWLAEVKKIRHTASHVPRVTGVQVLAKNKKNKVGIAFREAEFPLIFGYGVDDERSMLDWLKTYKADKLLAPDTVDGLIRTLDALREQQDRAGIANLRDGLRSVVTQHWMHIEAELAPPMRKY